MENNQPLFIDEFTRRSTRVFLKLSRILEKRTADQCRTHHQKIQNKCNGNILQIIGLVKAKIIKTLQKKANRNDMNAK